MKVAVIGSGVYGKAMANLLVQNGNDVTIWTEKTDNSVIAPDNTKLTNSFEEALKNSELVYVLTGSKFTESVFRGMKPHVRDDMVIILGSKGILDDGKVIMEICEEIIPNAHIAIISGPTFAVDIGALEPVGFTLATEDYEDFKKIQSAMKSIYLEYSKDLLGTELAGSLKNAYAIGSGILGGFNYGNSVRCLYITRVLDEIKNIFKQLGCDENTILTLAGIGDLVLTCTSLNSRNFTFGSLFSLGNKATVDEYLKTNTVEGYENLRVFEKLFREKHIEAPIIMKVASIVNGTVNAQELINLILK